MSWTTIRTLLAGSALCAALGLGDAAAVERPLQIRLRGIAVIPDEGAAITPIGGDVDVTTTVVPELDLTYFIADHWALELIAATNRHSASAKATAVGDVPLGPVWLLPPTLSLQYHFTPYQRIRPYLGAGLNYTFFYRARGQGVSDLHFKNSPGYALQAGVDIALDDHWLVNLDVKKLFLSTKASMWAGATRIQADVDLDPWIIGAGVGYRF